MRLYIAEKPSMAREIAACLGNPKQNRGYIKTSGGIVTWLVGHVLQQVMPAGYDEKYRSWRMEDLPIIPKVWKLEVSDKTEDQFNIVKNLIGKADEIIHAGDPDREGQLLVDEVLDFVGNKKPVKRILLNALDEKSIRRANSDLRDNREFFNLKQSALARSRADWLIGINLSRAYTIAAQRLGHRDMVFPIGRVKTPTLALVVRREREILNFKPVDFFQIRAQFQHENGIFSAQWKPSEKLFDMPYETRDKDGKILSPTAFDSEGRLINKSLAETFMKKFSAEPHEGKISSYKTTEKKESQPLPFSLSSLQITAGKMFGYTPQQVLDAAQSLYEKKFTTYPRSDCEYLPTNQFGDAEKILNHLSRTEDENLGNLITHADPQIKSRAWNNSKISAHHAIIPTTKPLTGGISLIEQNIYKLIAKNYAVQFYPLHIYDETVVNVNYKDENFSVRGKVVKQIGWREFFIMARAKSEDEIENLPQMKNGDSVTYKKSELKKSTTKPPVRFTSSSLVQGMKEIHKYVKNPESKKLLKDVYGIGTEATRAQIIDDLINRQFLKISRKALQPTEKAYMLIDALPDEMTYPDETAIWEDKLHSMSEGDGTLEEFLNGQAKFTAELCQKAEATNIKIPDGLKKCPRCQKGVMVKRNGSSGEFWSCSDYPNCKMTLPDKNGEPDFSKVQTADGLKKCPRCQKGIMMKLNGSSGEFWGCSDYPNCKMTLPDKNGEPDFSKVQTADGVQKCPSCQKGIMVKRNGKNGEFWSCSDYPDCKTSANDNNGKPDFNAKKKSFGRKNFSGQKNNDMKVVNMAEYVSKNFL